MADYCHRCGYGLGCPQWPDSCPPDCAGDFTDTIRKWTVKLEPGYEVPIGLCEGCGAHIFLHRMEDKQLELVYVPAVGPYKDKEPVHVPWPPKQEVTQNGDSQSTPANSDQEQEEKAAGVG